MNCDICGRHYHAQRLPFLCPIDARNQLYEHRLAHAAALIQNEQLEQQVNGELLLSSAADAEDEKPPAKRQQQLKRQPKQRDALSAKSRLDAWECERQEILERTNDVVQRAEKLRADLEAARSELERRKDTNRRRRSDLAAASNGTATRRSRMQDEVERSISMTRFKWNRSYDAMAATRGFLCMEAAKLYGLRRLKRGSTVHYEIGGREIVNPYSMSNLQPEVISTSLGHVTHILMLACHYLSIRLPAEVTLPHRDYPRPTIFSLSSSYSHGDVPFPGTATFQPSHAAGRDHEPFQRVPRARPLYIDKQLPVLSKEDSWSHTMFLEGVALLAYDIAWACGSQGVPIGERSSFDDVFNIGRNLYNLLIGSQLLNNPAGRIFSTSSTPASPGGTMRQTDGGVGGGREINEFGKAATMMGRYSHGTAHTFLGDDVIRAFKLPSPNRLADRLKTRLSSESTLPDWEVLDDESWAADDHNNMEDGVLSKGGQQNGGSRAPDRRLFGVESVASVITDLEDTLALAEMDVSPRSRRPEKVRSAGTSGWTKLRTRSGSTK
ncbi:hypothetical protein CMQ_5669 [Grosmannia clavigera kw1407]|uniref:Autophagy-related protein 14 n=1 Tax=Grosmannia clavigera (strain kw1407 / UAMH 11150) TaxID=655863 RepID=F0XT13_GROCL|nr:uncharacterized protein CMQ_5669 [Grosmannia clavigera kw1407]EFW99248.1 hypothetical protein CMQ_5669 [Grosmannia clavigera kw1407]